MPLTSKQKQAAFKLRKRQSGLVELRGIWINKKHNTKQVKADVIDFINNREEVLAKAKELELLNSEQAG